MKPITLILMLALFQSAPQLFYGSTPATKEDVLQAIQQNHDLLTGTQNFRLQFTVERSGVSIMNSQRMVYADRTLGQLFNCQGKVRIESKINIIREGDESTNDHFFIDDGTEFLSTSSPAVFNIYTPDSTESFESARMVATTLSQPSISNIASGAHAIPTTFDTFLGIWSELDGFNVQKETTSQGTQFLITAIDPITNGNMMLRVNFRGDLLLESVVYEDPTSGIRRAAQYEYQELAFGIFPKSLRNIENDPLRIEGSAEGKVEFFDVRSYSCEDPSFFSPIAFVQTHAMDGSNLHRHRSTGTESFRFQDGSFILAEEIRQQLVAERNHHTSGASESRSMMGSRLILGVSLILLAMIVLTLMRGRMS